MTAWFTIAGFLAVLSICCATNWPIQTADCGPWRLVRAKRNEPKPKVGS